LGNIAVIPTGGDRRNFRCAVARCVVSPLT
jgi:hypothetical protein